MQNLWWRQWHENKVCLAVLSVGMLLSACYSIAYEIGHGYRAAIGGFSGVASLYAIGAAIFLAIRTSQGERAAGTLSFTAALPVSMRRQATVRILASVAVLTVPMLIAAGAIAIALSSGVIEQAAPRMDNTNATYARLIERETASLPTALEQLASVTVISMLAGIELLLIVSLCGCRLRRSAQVGFLGVVVGFSLLLAGTVLWSNKGQQWSQIAYGVVLPQSLVIHWGYGADDGTYTDHELISYRWVSLAAASLFLLFLGRLFVVNYGALPRSSSAKAPRRLRWAIPSLGSYLLWRLPGRVGALIWLELRQSLPLAGYGLLLAFVTTAFSMLTDYQPYASYGVAFQAQLPHSMFVVGLLWASVVGSGIYAADLGDRLGAFWRSRPISHGMWFWCKFIVGLAAVLLVLDGTTVLVSWTAPRDTPTTGMSWAYVACMPLIHAFMYAMAVLGTCWLRRPVLGGILAFCAFTLFTVTVASFPATYPLELINIYNELLFAEREGKADFTAYGYPQMYGLVAGMIVVCSLLASHLVRPLQRHVGSVSAE